LVAVGLVLFVRRAIDLAQAELRARLADAAARAERAGRLMERSGGNLRGARASGGDARTTLEASPRIDAASGEVTAEAAKIERQVDEAGVALGDILCAMADLTGRADDRSAHVTETAAAIEQMDATLRTISDIAGKKLEAALGLFERAKEGQQAMDESVDAIEKLKSYIDGVVGTTGVIEGIAGQTNLLAMNAAIEAAHAGDAGRGFSVVSDEVRKLAETSSASAREISGNLAKLVDDIKGTGGAIRGSGEAFRRIETEIVGVVEAMDEIARGMKEASIIAGAGGIRGAMENIRTRSDALVAQAEGIDAELRGL
jgi:methyl-accepting chemotaxis protein